VKNFPMAAQSEKKHGAPGVIILGAGASSRMGCPKLLLPWGETSIIGHIIGQWKKLGAVQIAVVCRPADDPLNEELDRLDFPRTDRIENPQPERGMFSSILCAADWDGWEKDLAVWAVVLGDQPHLQFSTLRALLEFQSAHADAICQPACDGHARHPVLLPRQAFSELRRACATTLKEFLLQTSCPIAACPVQDDGLGFDLNRPGDYERALRFANQAESGSMKP
jgi:molybdenum cofactor cytidylyltransferase